MASVHDQIITNSNITNATKAANDKINGKHSNTTVGSDEFLYLLTQQLQYQDPMNPMDNTDMLAQEAQFATLEQMENLADNFSKFSNMYQANSLLGQTVGVNVDGKETVGKVEYTDYSDKSGASVSINGKMYPIDAITKVFPENYNPDNKEEKAISEENTNFFKNTVDLISSNVGKIKDAVLKYEKSNSSPKI